MDRNFLSISLSSLLVLAPLASHGAELQPIVYSASGQLCSVSPDGDSDSCIRSDFEYSSPVWQPNEKYLVAGVGRHDGEKALVLLDAHGKKIRMLENSTHFIRPAWKPNGQFVYAINYDVGPALGRWDKDGKNFRLIPVVGLKDNQKYFQMLSISPSGMRIALLNEDFNSILLVREVNNELVAEKRTPAGFSYITESKWIDESRIIFIGKRQSGPSDLWMLNVENGEAKKIGIPGLSLRDFLALSPNRNEVIVCATKNGEAVSWSLWKFLLGATSAMRLTAGIEDVEPNWFNGH